MDFLNSLEPVLKTFWYIAIPTSAFFLLQTILTFIGADAGDGIDADFDGDFSDGEAPFQLFSLRNLINFLLGFSWTGIAFYDIIVNDWYLIILALTVGCFFVYVFFIIIQQVQKLSEDNSFKINSVINKTGEVYLNIPPKMSGKGKILVNINGTTRELDAMTRGEGVKVGTAVEIIEIKDNNILIISNLK